MTKVAKTKNGLKVQHSDHNTILIEFNLMLEKHVCEKLELYNLKNNGCQAMFRIYTSNTNMLSSIFDSDEDVNTLTNRFLKKLDGCIAYSFRKTRISQVKDNDDNLYDKVRYLKSRSDEKSKAELNEVLNKIAEES